MDNIPMRPPKLPGYDFVQMLGSGATATVYLYNQRMPARPVAVKASAKTLDPRAAALFNREANFMAKLSSHPYILPVYGAGVTSDGHGYIVIEYAPGGTYNSIMKARSMTCEQVLDLGIKLSSALFTAHRSNIIHHDIKPSNILITSQGLPVLGDFGISTDVYDRTETGFSPPWAPPEVLQHLTNGSEAADIYSLAATLYAMFVGCSPFQHDYHPRSQSELISLIVNQPLPRLNRPRRAGRCGSGAAPGPEQGPRPAVLLRVGVRTCHAACAIRIFRACHSRYRGRDAGLSQRHRASAPGHGPARSDHPFVTAMGQTGGYYRRYTCGDHRSGTDIRLRGRSPHGQRHRIRYQTGGDARHQG